MILPSGIEWIDLGRTRLYEFLPGGAWVKCARDRNSVCACSSSLSEKPFGERVFKIPVIAFDSDSYVEYILEM